MSYIFLRSRCFKKNVREKNITTAHTTNVSLQSWCESWWSEWGGVGQASPLSSYSNVPLSTLSSWRGSHTVQLTPRKWGFTLQVPGGKVSSQINWSPPAWAGGLSSIIYLFSPWFTEISMDSCIVYTFSCHAIASFIFCCSYCSNSGHWELFHWLVSLSSIPSPCFLQTSLLCGTVRWSRLILNIPFYGSGVRHFSKEPWSPLLESGIRNQDLEAWSACCC